MTNEALRRTIDALTWEKERLMVENLKLREENSSQDKLVDVKSELEYLRHENSQLSAKVEEVGQLMDQLGQAERSCEELQQQLDALGDVKSANG